jgi:hypothetical protein
MLRLASLRQWEPIARFSIGVCVSRRRKPAGKGLALKGENEASDRVVKDVATDERVATPRSRQSRQRNRHDALRQPMEKATGVETLVA